MWQKTSKTRFFYVLYSEKYGFLTNQSARRVHIINNNEFTSNRSILLAATKTEATTPLLSVYVFSFLGSPCSSSCTVSYTDLKEIVSPQKEMFMRLTFRLMFQMKFLVGLRNANYRPVYGPLFFLQLIYGNDFSNSVPLQV